jgi:hypothetical protein
LTPRIILYHVIEIGIGVKKVLGCIKVFGGSVFDINSKAGVKAFESVLSVVR